MKIHRHAGVVIVCLAVLVFGVSMPAKAAPAAPYVDAVVQPPCDNAAFNTALATVQAGSGGTLTFNCGTKIIIFPLLKLITKTVIIDGGNTITLSGGNTERHFLVNTGQLTLKNIILTNGNTQFYGAGGSAIYLSSGASLIADNVTFQENTSNNYGGSAILDVGNAAITLNNTLVQSNTNNSYGAINSTGPVTITNSILRNNWSKLGGGAISAEGKVLIENTTLFDNKGIEGSGIYYSGASMVLLNTTISNHDEDAILNTGTMFLKRMTFNNNNVGIHNRGSASLTNVTFSNNRTGLFVRDGGTATLDYVTIFGNSGSIEWGINRGLNGGVIRLSNTVIDVTAYAGTACFAYQDINIISDGNNVSNDGSCTSFLNKVSDRNWVSGKLGLLANNGGKTQTHLPQADSPLIDKGVCFSGITEDQRGLPRPQGAACDIGAVEVQPPAPQPSPSPNPIVPRARIPIVVKST